MAFMDVLKKGAKIAGDAGRSAVNGMQELNSKVQEYKISYDSKTNDELVSIMKRNRSMAEKMAASQILKSRGYSE
jgi:hypothetical protein